MDSSRLLIIDDDAKFSRLLGGYLQRFGYTVDSALDGRLGLEKARNGNYAALILDVLLPGMNGWDVLRELRREHQTPVLMLTALGDEPDRISGLEIGADDYLPKTCSMREVLARLRALLRRSAISARARADAPDDPVEVGSLRMVPAERSATLRGEVLQLTAHEYELLLALARAHPRVKSREQLLLDVSDRDLEAFDRSIDVRIGVLRRKLGDDARNPRIIETVRGVGYRLRAAEPRRMKVRLSLRGKVLMLAAINAVLVASALVWFVRTQLTQDLGSLLIGESRARITAVARQVAQELPMIDLKERDAMLARFSAAHGVRFYLFRLDGGQAAGPPIDVPPEIDEHFELLRAKSPLVERQDVQEGILRRGAGLKSGDSFRLDPARMDKLLLAIMDEPPFFTRAGPGYWVIFRIPLRARDQLLFQPGQLVMMSGSLLGTPFFFDLRPWLALCGMLLAIVLACWLPLVHGANRSIATLAEATARIAKGNFTAKVAIRRSDELGQLGESLNRMATQLEGYVHGEKRFLRDAAHELRSPLARMQAALGNLLESPAGPETGPLLEDLREEIELMSSLTGELLAFAREENAHGRAKLEPVNLSQAAARVLATENPGGLADVRVEVDSAVAVTAHPDSLFRGLSNVVRNAIRYAGPAGPITLAAERLDGSIRVTVRDRGPGIPEEALEMVFTPFFRVDPSRARTTGGNGLGMAIARTCVENCEGTIRCRNLDPGLEVSITLRNA